MTRVAGRARRRTLCHAYNVRKTTLDLPPGAPLPATVDMPVLRPVPPATHTHLNTPTHVLAVLDTPTPATASSEPRRPLLVPVSADALAAGFKNDFARELRRQGHASPAAYVHWDATARTQVLTLPLRPLYVPHPPSIPLLLLFGLGEDFLRACAAQLERGDANALAAPPVPLSVSETAPDSTQPERSSSSPPPSPPPPLCTGLLATYLLPLAAIEEFPATAAMVRRCVTSKWTSSSGGGNGWDEDGREAASFNQGLWRNALLLAPREQAVTDIVGTASRVSRDALRVRERQWEWEEGKRRGR